MEKKLKYSLLLQFYGKLLTQRQYEIMGLYYDEDFSLAEISENLGISRQAVLDALRNGSTALDGYEEKLGIIAKNAQIKSKLMCARDLIMDNEVELACKELNELSENL